jgi:hypothetical protein
MGQLKPLREFLQAAGGRLPEGWLYLPASRNWTLNTEGMVIGNHLLTDAEMFDEDTPLVAHTNNLISTLDTGTIEDIDKVARTLQDPPSDDLLLEAFLYYFNFDAFLPSIGAPDPPPLHVVIHNIDRSFYDSLGLEDASKKCRRDGCQRGVVSLSVLCRVHHFESVRGKKCPFDD